MSVKPGVFAVTPTITAGSAYASGNSVGGIQAVGGPDAAPDYAVLDSLTVIDAANQKAPLTLLFFAQDPTGSAGGATPATVTDQAAFAFGTSAPLLVGKVDVAAGDYETVNNGAVACKTNLVLPMQADGPSGVVRKLYVAVVTTSTPTYGHASDLTFTYGFVDFQ
jgi:hypothetical protein